jgi:hypothetical protein
MAEIDIEKMAQNVARKAIQELRDNGVFVGRWIPVSERLPEEAFGCLVTVEEDDIYGEPHRVMYPDFVGYDGETWNDADGEVIPFDVIAWMPLPEPYKAESEE